MEIKRVADQPGWDGWFKKNCKNNKFLQSAKWGEILLAEGKRIERLRLIDSGKTIEQAQVVYNNLPFGWQYAFSPKGGIGDKELLKYLKKQNCIFYRIEPKEKTPLNNSIKKTIDINPRATVILDLGQPEEELLKQMKPKTRYNMRLAERKNLQISNKKDLESFLKLSKQTSKRDDFSLHPKRHYQHVLDSSISYQLTAVHKDEAVASNIFVGFGDTFTYLYGASDYANRSLMAPYLLQWLGIKMAKSMGYKYYDLFGIAPAISHKLEYNYDKKHQYAGVTRFKLGFGGKICEEPGTLDVVLDKNKYTVYKFLRRLRRIFR